ncbi:hypothetical protein TNIN_13021 [Trichonephila inaurata madagascariensis]|uniref:Uncharacterized protein n=1 Tax=Trichonephila inaurata madagascariensis TaxID=2747483 RepID=A0A8X6YDS0_9ARAC|nr:hypothetical protein TNIN_13021 [Trichonephila inaurata madagascariensis]
MGFHNRAETKRECWLEDYYTYRPDAFGAGGINVFQVYNQKTSGTIHVYVKEIESERRYDTYDVIQPKRCINFQKNTAPRDAIVSNADTTEIDNSIILPSSYTGSPRYMQEYIRIWLYSGWNVTDRQGKTPGVFYLLQLLLVNVTGPLSFQDIRKVNGQQYPMYKDACFSLGLLEDDTNGTVCLLKQH